MPYKTGSMLATDSIAGAFKRFKTFPLPGDVGKKTGGGLDRIEPFERIGRVFGY
jgi:hypothetical protein